MTSVLWSKWSWLCSNGYPGSFLGNKSGVQQGRWRNKASHVFYVQKMCISCVM